MLKLAYRHGKSVAALAASGVLAFSTLGTGFADGPAQEGKGKQGIFGSVTAKGENAFTVMTKQGSTVDLAVKPDTQFQVPGREEDSFADLAVGSRVAVLAEGEAGAQSARKVMLVPSRPQREHRALTVMEVNGSTVVAEDAEGNRIEVELDHQPSADIKGQLITFIGTKRGQSNHFKANAEVMIEQIVKRLEAQAKELDREARVEADAKIRARKEKHRAELRARLEANMQRHLDLFAEIIAKARPQARASLEAALRATLQGYQAALEALGGSKTDVEERLHLRTLHGTVEAINPSTSSGQALSTGLGQPDLTTPATGSGQALSIASGQLGPTGEITVQSPGGADVTLKLTADTQILVGGKPGKPSDISEGDRVTLGYNRETLIAAKVRVETEAKAQGRIKSVDRASERLVVALPSGSTLELKLTPNTRIEVNGQKATAADLKADALVEVEYNTRTMEALEVEASTRAEGKGTVKSVDAAAGTVTILTEEGQEITLKVTNTTRVDIHGLLFGILGVSPGMHIKAEFDLTTGEAWELDVRGERHREGRGEVKAEAKAMGTIVNVNSASGKMALNLDDGGSLEVRVTGDTEIEFNGRAAGLAGLEVGARAKIEYDPESRVAWQVEARSKDYVPVKIQLRENASGNVAESVEVQQ